MSGPRAEFLAIGSELLEPYRSDTNGSFIAERLGAIGIALRFRTIVGDAFEDLREAFRAALARSEVIVATGGLGPTVDDLTRDAIASALGLRLVEDPAVLRGIEDRFRRLGRDMPPRNRLQAMVPEGALVLPNPVGTAPGLFLSTATARIALLPGVPAEMRPMMESHVLPRLPSTGGRFAHRVLKITGLAESEVDARLADAHRSAGDVAWTILAAPGQIEIHLRERVPEGAAPSGIERLDRAIEAAIGRHLFGRDRETLEEVVGTLLLRSGASLAVAESLTGGAIAARITAVPGASRYFLGGVVCYSDAVKMRCAGVSPETLARRGAVSGEAALEMAAGVRADLGSTWGLSSTGYAGPGGGADGTPPGTVFLGIAGPSVSRSVALRLPGDRAMVRDRSTQSALDLLRRSILETPA